jgi:hypothetical protein
MGQKIKRSIPPGTQDLRRLCLHNNDSVYEKRKISIEQSETQLDGSYSSCIMYSISLYSGVFFLRYR